jgi:hypothetical protein
MLACKGQRVLILQAAFDLCILVARNFVASHALV